MVNKIKVSEIEELMTLVDFERNNLEKVDVANLYTNSSVYANWICSKGHFFKEKVSTMYRRKNKCFYCTGRSVWPGENDLQTLYPDLAKEFDVEKNGISPIYISPKDTKTYMWTCENKHPSFPQSVEHRVNRKTTCPYCTERKVITGNNDLETLFPDIASEWDYENNKGVSPNDISPYTYKSYSWKCPKGHTYTKRVIYRTKFHKRIDCPKCLKAFSTSFPEQAIYYYAQKCFPDAINRYKEPFDNQMELDIYIPSYRMGIEYDGIAFHNSEDQHDRELRKYETCKKNRIRLVRIKESEDTWRDTADDIFYVKQKMTDKELSEFLLFLFSKLFTFSKYTFTHNDAGSKESLFNRFYGFPTDFNISRDRAEILEYLVDVENSFGALYPELAELWSKEDNGNLTPFMFTPGSGYPAKWKCPTCGNVWESQISSIVSRNVRSCKACSMKRNGSTITKVKTRKHGSLAEKSEVLLKQWDYDANGNLSPYEIPLNYSFDVAWKCDVCGYTWLSSPNSRMRKDKIAGCPHCTGRVAMSGIDDFETLYPEAARTWDYKNNNGTLPSQIKPFSGKRYYFICPGCQKSYLTRTASRIKGRLCPDCGHDLVGKKNAKSVGQFNEEGILIQTYQGLHEAAREMQVGPNAIFQAVKNKTKSKGYYWRYL